MIIDCYGHYTTAPKALEAWRNAQVKAFENGTMPPEPATLNTSDENCVSPSKPTSSG